jgi:hypothetical protein
LNLEQSKDNVPEESRPNSEKLPVMLEYEATMSSTRLLNILNQKLVRAAQQRTDFHEGGDSQPINEWPAESKSQPQNDSADLFSLMVIADYCWLS